MKAYLCCLLLLVSWTVSGQQSRGIRLDFRYSRLVLTNNDTLTGYVALHIGPDLLYLRQPDGTLRAYEPAAVQAFAVQGEITYSRGGVPRSRPRTDSTVVRLFRSFERPARHPGQRPEVAFYEQLSAGPVLLLRRPYAITHPVAIPTAVSLQEMQGQTGPVLVRGQPVPPPSAARFQTANEARDAFFLALPSGELRPLTALKKDFLAVFPTQAEALKKYAQAHGLGFSNAFELHELVTYANSLPTATN